MNSIGSLDSNLDKLIYHTHDENKLNLPKLTKSPLRKYFGSRKLHK